MRIGPEIVNPRLIDQNCFEIIANMEKQYFQDYMPGNICFGCGKYNKEGLQIRSCWDGEEAVCIFNSEERFQGWKGIMNGGILAVLIDCHTMCTAMAAAYRAEGRGLDSEPVYHFATASLQIQYLKPTRNDIPVELRATVREISPRKVILDCRVMSDGVLTAEAEVIAVKVFDSSKEKSSRFIKHV